MNRPMKGRVIAAVSSLLLLAGCASVGPSVTVVTARKVAAGADSHEIGDVFTRGENVVAIVTIDGTLPEGTTAPATVTARWYNDDRLVAARKRAFDPGRMPHTAWFQVSGALLGTGECRVGIYLDDELLASRGFRVEDR